MRRVVGGDRVDASVREAGDQRVAILARGKRRIHLVARIVANVFVGQREVVRRHFAGHRAGPCLFAARTYSSEPRADMCAICRRAPSAPPSPRRAPTQIDSDGRGIPLQAQPDRIASLRASPRRQTANGPRNDRSPADPARGNNPSPGASACAVAMGLPSSLTATMPALFIAAISASASPLLPTDAAPIGHTRTRRNRGSALDNRARHRRVVVHRARIRHAAYGRESAARRCARSGFDRFRRFSCPARAGGNADR